MNVDEFLEPYNPDIKKICGELRAVISSLPIVMEEKVYLGWKLIGYRVKNGTKSHYVGFIAPLKSEVRLGFEYGVKIKHSAVKLEGAGTQVRYVSFTTPGHVKQKELVPVILEAIEIAMKRK
ncbi:MAG: hypothetical protein HYV29_11890 [Ignavibacteriales bacterium]|nr:hypothetical protein [Ignavibacteriales bacterium]